ncbi:InlB B-repeat-containing protein [[Clostridium] innocuum]|nr:InlB B-repeat-containing protein [Erysipelotrichaceae bacterium]MCR0381775.1 InlB B-repeat-containing protein [[Clostridium] innocuum]MCR0414555.1 InlB B-repeat-containing protein [[Clostridium] innocuum]MCR0535192.1 InlB B-repeat-containing protein [[Clostridium] innocuum]MCR0539428.1 InlB B-repeat-containing protein [[Clostridium] innocuum]
MRGLKKIRGRNLVCAILCTGITVTNIAGVLAEEYKEEDSFLSEEKIPESNANKQQDADKLNETSQTEDASTEAPEHKADNVLSEMPKKTLAKENLGMQITTAVIKDDAGTEQSLLEENALFTIDYTKSVTLHVKVQSTLNLKNKRVEINVPDGLIVVEYPKPNSMTGLVASVSPEKIEELNSDNTYGSYRPKSGTITYSLRDTAEYSSFNIILAPDTTLWNKKLGATMKNPLEVSVYSGQGDEQREYQKVSGKAVIAGDKLTSGPVMTSWDSKRIVPAAANTPFKMQQIRFRPDKTRYSMGMFFQKLEVTIALPYNSTRGTYAEYVRTDFDTKEYGDNWMDPVHHKDEQKFQFNEKIDNINHTVTLIWENMYIPRDDYFTPYFQWKDGEPCDAGDKIEWRNPKIQLIKADGIETFDKPTAVGGTITYADGLYETTANTVNILNNDFNKENLDQFKAGNASDIRMQGASSGDGISGKSGIVSVYDSAPDMVYFLGQFLVSNQGTMESEPQTVEFIYQDSDELGVIAQRIPATSGNQIEVWYTTNKTSETKYSHALTSINGFALFTAEMAGLKKDEYFTNIRANVGVYDANYMGYVESRTADPSSACAGTLGKLKKATEPKNIPSFVTMKMYDTQTRDETVVPATFDAKFVSASESNQVSLALINTIENGKKIPVLDIHSTIAGETVQFNGVIASTAYPYSIHRLVMDTEIYIRLPKSIKIENLKLTRLEGSTADRVLLGDGTPETGKVKSAPLQEKTDYTILDSECANDYRMYKISFESGKAPVGWFTQNLGQYQIGLSFDMKIDKVADAMALDMRNCVRIKSASLASDKAGGTQSEYIQSDTDDWDGDADTTEKFCTFNKNADDTKLSIVAARLGLSFGFGAKLSEGDSADISDKGYANYEIDKKIEFLKEDTHSIDFRFTAKNETGRPFGEEDAKAFYYYIPVPKKGDNWDTHIQDKPFEFNMKMSGPATMIGSSQSDLQVQYSTTVDSKAAIGDPLYYNNKDNYVDADKISDWSTVKMLRISAKDTVTEIPNNAEIKIYLHYEAEKATSALVGSVVNFGPCGYTPYTVGNEENGGHMPLPHIQAEFQTGIIEGKIFVDRNFNGVYDEDTDELYKGDVKIEAPHQNAVGSDDTESHETTAKNGTFKFTGRRADTYHVKITNPGNTDINSAYPLKFSLPEDGIFKEDGNNNSATGTIVVNCDEENLKKNTNLSIGLQAPHTITFKAENATISKASIKVWHKNTVGTIPTVKEADGWRFDGQWSDADNKVYSTKELKELPIMKDRMFTAQINKLYTVRYDSNGGTGDVPGSSAHIANESVPIAAKPDNLKREGAIFAGWSKEKISSPLSADASQEVINKIIIDDVLSMPEKDLTLYAVWAIDGNGNGNPDYNDDAVHVRYHDAASDRKDVICPHYHVAGEKVQLSSTAKDIAGKQIEHDESGSVEGTSGSFTFENGNHIFVGWSIKPTLDTIITNSREYETLKDSIQTEVTMLETDAADPDGNTNVYAVWAADSNNNGIADYLEEHQLVYDANVIEGNVENMPTNDNKIYLPGNKASLSETVPSHSEVNGKKVVFLGWTTTQSPHICERTHTPIETIKKVTFGNENVTVYAAWGYDENGNGIADVLETYSLKYDLNGGNGTTPAEKNGIKHGESIAITEEKGFTRNAREIFVGWSRQPYSAAFTAEQKADIENVLISGNTIVMGTENVTLYAVWAEDRNGNNQADYTEALSQLLYSENALNDGIVQNMPKDINKYLPKEKAILSDEKPMHSKVDGKAVVFIGWTTKENNKIYQWNDCELETITEIIFGKENITVYAAWGFDEDGNGTADVLEDWGVISYDLAGGISPDGIEKYDEEVIKIGKTHMVKTAPMKDGYKFIGWKYKDKVYQPGDSIEVKAQTASMKLIAEWKGGNLTISNLVDGTKGDTKKDFHFRVYLQDTKINGLFGDISFKSGVSDEFTLKHGERKFAINLPLGTAYEVVEVESNQDGYITTSKGAKGKITTNASTVKFLNTKNSTPTEPEVKTGSLMISNTVAGNEEEKKKDFTFTVTLSDKRITGVYGDMRFKQGVASVVLKHEESITAKGLPSGIRYTVEDTDNNKAYKVEKSGETGFIKEGEIAFAKFLYYRKDSVDINEGVKDNDLESSMNVNTPGTKTKEVPETGDKFNRSLWVLLLVASGIVISILTASKKRKGTHGK